MHRVWKVKDPFSLDGAKYLWRSERECIPVIKIIIREWHLISWSSWRTPIARGIVFASDATLDDNILTRIQIQRLKD